MEFDLRKYWRLVTAWWWLLVIGGVVPTLISYRLISERPNLYQARVILMVGTTMQSTNPNATEMSISRRLALGYAEMVRYRPVTEEVIEKLGLSTTPEALAAQISTAVSANANLLEIYVTDMNPQAAAVIANTVAEVLIDKSPAAQAQGEQQRFIKAQLDDLQSKISNLEDDIEKQTAELADLTSAAEIRSAQDNLDSLQQVLSRYRSEYGLLLQSYVGDSVNQLTIVEPARVPTHPTGGNKVLVLGVSAGAGLGLALGGIFLMAYLDDTLKWEDVRDHSLLGLAVLGGVGRMASDRKSMFERPDSRTKEAESFRSLRAAILFRRLRHPFQTILVTSASPQEGKSFVSANLGVVLANAGLRVIIVDADLRKPSLHMLFDLPNAVGVADHLGYGMLPAKQASFEGLQETGVSGLRFLAAGQAPLDPLPLLMSSEALTLVNRLREVADIVIFDTPPLAAAADAIVLASHCDTSILVVAHNQTSQKQLEMAIRRFQERQELEIMGIVFNRIRVHDPNSYYYRRRGPSVWNRLLRRLTSIRSLARLFQSPMDGAEYLSLSDAAEELGITGQMARRWVKMGRLPATKAGVRHWVRREDLTILLGRPARDGEDGFLHSSIDS